MAGLQQQGFGQAQQQEHNKHTTNQMQMAQAAPQFQGADIAGLGSMGATPTRHKTQAHSRCNKEKQIDWQLTNLMKD